MTRPFPILFVLPALTVGAQQPLVLLDPARGGADSGARIADRMPEKQVTLDLAGRLASLLRARGFLVQMTREADVDVSSDSRAALANNTHPLACLLLYAAPSGNGVHLYTSAQRESGSMTTAVQWDRAQAAYVGQSRTLAGDLHAALDHARVKASTGQTWMRPLDNMQCPAVAVEVTPEDKSTGPDDSTYQSHIANAVANTLLQWRGKVASMNPPPNPVPQQPAPAAQPHAVSPAEGAAPKAPATGDATAPAAETRPAAPTSSAAPKLAPITRPAVTPQPAGTGAPPSMRQPATPGVTGSGLSAPAGDSTPRRVPRPVPQPAPIVRQPAPPAERTEP